MFSRGLAVGASLIGLQQVAQPTFTATEEHMSHSEVEQMHEWDGQFSPHMFNTALSEHLAYYSINPSCKIGSLRNPNRSSLPSQTFHHPYPTVRLWTLDRGTCTPVDRTHYLL
jgi:hypothetical protein